MPRPRPPCRVDTLSFPVFGLSWYGHPGSGTSVVAYCGGGGAAKTGVTNKIVVLYHDAELEQQYEIDTDSLVCISVMVYESNNSLWLLGALVSSVNRYALMVDENNGMLYHELRGQLPFREDGCNALTVHPMGEVFAVGCESGNVHVYRMVSPYSDDPFVKLHTCDSPHSKAVCALQFAIRSPMLVSSAKDGTARVWNEGKLVDVLRCDVSDPTEEAKKKNKKKKRKDPQILVRGCAFGDLEGRVVYTVASEKRGRAFLSRWMLQEQGYGCENRLACHDSPISAMSLSGDMSLLTLGAINGTVLLFDVMAWKVLKKFPEIHDLPVTCIAARPFPTPLHLDETNGVNMHAVSASADSQLAWLTLQKRATRKQSSQQHNSSTMTSMLSTLVWGIVIGYCIVLLMQETIDVCVNTNDPNLMECILYSVLLAPAERAGVMVPPH